MLQNITTVPDISSMSPSQNAGLPSWEKNDRLSGILFSISQLPSHRNLTFLCGGEKLEYHQAIVFSRSHFLTNIIESCCNGVCVNSSNDVVISLDGINPVALRLLMNCLYTGRSDNIPNGFFNEVEELREILELDLDISEEESDIDSIDAQKEFELDLDNTVEDISLGKVGDSHGYFELEEETIDNVDKSSYQERNSMENSVTLSVSDAKNTDAPTLADSKGINCDMCGASFNLAIKLKMHIKKNHKQMDQLSRIDSKNVKMESKEYLGDGDSDELKNILDELDKLKETEELGKVTESSTEQQGKNSDPSLNYIYQDYGENDDNSDDPEPVFTCGGCEKIFSNDSKDMFYQHLKECQEEAVQRSVQKFMKEQSSSIQLVESEQKGEKSLNIKNEKLELQCPFNVDVDRKCPVLNCTNQTIYDDSYGILRHITIKHCLHKFTAKYGGTSCDECEITFNTNELLILHRSISQKHKEIVPILSQCQQPKDQSSSSVKVFDGMRKVSEQVQNSVLVNKTEVNKVVERIPQPETNDSMEKENCTICGKSNNGPNDHIHCSLCKIPLTAIFFSSNKVKFVAHLSIYHYVQVLKEKYIKLFEPNQRCRFCEKKQSTIQAYLNHLGSFHEKVYEFLPNEIKDVLQNMTQFGEDSSKNNKRKANENDHDGNNLKIAKIEKYEEHKVLQNTQQKFDQIKSIFEAVNDDKPATAKLEHIPKQEAIHKVPMMNPGVGTVEKKNFSCTQCGKAYKSKQNLTQHMTIHSGQKSYKCEQCNISWTFRSSYDIHRKKRHNQTDSQ